MTRAEFLTSQSVVIAWTRVCGDPMKGETTHFCVTLRKGEVWHSVRYSCGSGCFPKYNKAYEMNPPNKEALLNRYVVPNIPSFLDSLVLDTRSFVDNVSFEAWCKDFWDGTPSLLARRTWKACKREWKQLREILGDAALREFVNIEEEV